MKEGRRPIRVLIAKIGLDGHDRGAKVITLGLRNEGMEVIYTGLRQTAESIVQACIQEDVDVIGLSSLSGAHNYHFPALTKLLKEKGMDRILVIAGGMIPPEDIPALKQNGIAEIFAPGVPIKAIADFIRKNVKD
jgi:methylmalonyl-CoA mutase C-terminal domain/subunit